MTFRELRVLLAASRENYKKAVNKAYNEKQSALKELKETMIANTPAYIARKAEIEKAYDVAVGVAMGKESGAIYPAFDKLRVYERDRVQAVDVVQMGHIRALHDIPLSDHELQCLKDKYCTSKRSSYWAERAIEALAEKNGVSIEELGIEPGIARKTAVIDELLTQYERLLKDYEPERPFKPDVAVLLSDDVLDNAESIYKGYNAASEQQIADKAYWSVKSASTNLERVALIDNALRNAKGEIRNMLLCKLSGEDFGEMVMNLCNYREEIEGFRDGKAAEYERAIKAVQTVSTMTTPDTIRDCLADYAENSFLPGLLKKEASRNMYVASAINETGETGGETAAE